VVVFDVIVLTVSNSVETLITFHHFATLSIIV